MAQDEKVASKKVPEDKKDYCTRILMDEEEWKDPACRVLVSEYHKEGLKEQPPNVETDLDAFEEHWRKKGAINLKSEYHKDGAPYFEYPSGWDGHRPRQGETPEDAKADPSPVQVRETSDQPRDKGSHEPKGPKGKAPLDRTVSIADIEVIAYALFRFIFGTGVHIPIKRKGLANLDVTIKPKEILINSNEFYVSVPELAVWRITYSHKGKPVVDFGRGVKKGMKIHYLQAIILLVELWKLNRASLKAKQEAVRAAKAAELEGGTA